ALRANQSLGSCAEICSSATRARYDRARSERRLCSPVNRRIEMSATLAIRLAVFSRVHEVQAPCARTTTTAAARIAITDFRMTLTETRLNMTIHPDAIARQSFDCVRTAVRQRRRWWHRRRSTRTAAWTDR